jgi:peptidoglycan/LPS O-acetylase OafA/YrhL
MIGPSRGAGSDTFRPDIEGLRGVAVLLVVLFHGALIGVVPGGYVGVDVFFVISGFLITGLLVRERERTGTVSLSAFYARRVRRLLPAGLTVLVVTLAASFVILAPLDRASVALDAGAAALSIGNFRFASAEGDYFTSLAAPSPFLHYWSLAVEEQFYLAWPAVVLIATRVRRPRLGAGIALAIILVGSLLLCLAASGAVVTWAFYSLPTRAWQLSLGGLLAIGGAHLARLPRPVSVTVGWAGLAAILVASTSFDTSLAYPGAWAVVPTAGAAAIIATGLEPLGPRRLLQTSPLRLVGRISYSLYLWHWPILVLPAIALESEPPLAVRIALVASAFAIAWLSWRFVEEPFRAGFPTLARRPMRTVVAGAAAILAVVLAAGGLTMAAERVPQLMPELVADGEPTDPTAPAAPAEAPAASPTAMLTPSPVPSGVPSAEPDGTTDPTAPPASPSPEPSPVTYVRLPADIRPPLGQARTDEERLRGDGCLAFERVRVPPDCVYGDPEGSVTVALVGDSHAAQWFPALEAIAEARHWRLVTFVKVACPFIDMPVRNLALKREYPECAEFRDRTIERVAEMRPDLTLVSMSRFAIHPVRPEDRSSARQGEAVARAIDRLPATVALVVDTPDAGRDVPSCLSRHTSDTRRCAIPRATAFAGELGAIERLAAERTGAALIDLTDRICRGDPCPVAVDGMIVFRDHRHLTATFAGSLAPDLAAALDPLLTPPPAPSPQEGPSRPARAALEPTAIQRVGELAVALPEVRHR